LEKPIPPLNVPEKSISPYVTRFSNGMLLTFLAIPQLALWLPLGQELRLHFCPPATFLNGTLRPDFELAQVFAAVCLAMLARYWILVLVPSLRPAFGFEAPGKGRWKHIWSHVWLAGFLLCCGAFLIAEMSPFCLAPDHITLRYAPWQPVWRYDWSDVAAVQTSCARTGKGDYRFNLHYDLTLGDGRTINIAGSVPDFEPGYKPMMQALAAAGTHPPLDSRFVQMDCGYRNVRLLTRQP
jgi:hypothetical protein